MALALVPAAFSQPSTSYENFGLVECPPDIPPMIDASNFINHAQFFINFTNQTGLNPPLTAPLYETSDTLNYTNDFGAIMSCNVGFHLDTFSSQSSQRQRASTLFNNGTIDCGTLSTSNVFIIGGLLFNLTGSGAGAKCLVNASNIYNPGTINMGFDSLLSLTAENIDLTRGTLAMENTGFNGSGLLNSSIFFNGGFFDGYWGLGLPSTNSYANRAINPVALYGSTPARTQIHEVTNRTYVVTAQQLGGPSFVSYLLDTTDSSGSNRTVRAVFLSNTNPAITAKVYLQTNYPYAMDPDVVELSSVITDSRGITTNFLYIEDSFLYFTNIQLLLDGFAGSGISRPTYIPENYSITSFSPFFGPPPTPATSTNIPPLTFFVGGNGTVTNQYSAYQALFQPGSVVLADVAGQNVTNEPGRIELTADKYLTLPQAQISSASYILLKATNHFGGSAGAQIGAPFADIYLRSTNGLLNITNVLLPELPQPIGICDLFSGRWTNIVAGVTNRFHVLFVDAQLAPITPLMVQTLNLSATNAVTHTNDDSILISDVFNVTSSLLINTHRLTLTTNAPGSPAPVGTLNYLNPAILWPASTPRLQYLTNYGVIQCPNFAVFGGSQTSPYSSPANSTNPYAAFVNAGSVTNFGSATFASYFQNSGTFFATAGAIQLLQARIAVLTNGAFLAPGTAGTITIQGGSLLVSNHVIAAGNTLTLSLTNYLDDGSLINSVGAISNKNTWFAGYGFNLPVRPVSASLLATTVTNLGPAGAVVVNQWAGADLGRWSSGYVSNAALGRLILDGITNSLFSFVRTGPTNALYVDYLEFRDYTTNRDNSGNYTGISLDTNFTIYYAQAVANGVSVAEKLNGKRGLTGTNGGLFSWVSSYAGYYSSTTVTNTDGTSYQANAALRLSKDIDSDADGVFNAFDTTPFLIPSELGLAATFTNLPQRAVLLSWNTLPNSTNFVYFKPSLTATNWQPLTNQFFTNSSVYNSPIAGRTGVVDPLSGGSRYYRVSVEAAQP